MRTATPESVVLSLSLSRLTVCAAVMLCLFDPGPGRAAGLDGDAALARLREARAAQGLSRPYVRGERTGRVPGFPLDGLRVVRRPSGRVVRLSGHPWVLGDTADFGETTPERVARSFLDEWGDVWGLGEPDHDLVHLRTKRDDLGNAHVIFREEFQGVPVDRLKFVVHLDGWGRVLSINGAYLDGIEESTTPTLSFDDVRALELADAGELLREADLVLWDPTPFSPEEGPPVLAWRAALDGDATDWRPKAVWVDAHAGGVLWQEPLVLSAFDADIRNCNGGVNCALQCSYRNGALSWGNCTGDGFSTLLYTTLIYSTWSSAFGRDGYNDQVTGEIMDSGYDYDPGTCAQDCFAFTDATDPDAMVTRFCDQALSDDTVAHEYGHTLQVSEIGAAGADEPGAVAEHFSDCNTMWAEWAAQDWDLDTGAGCKPNCNDTRRRFDDPPAAAHNDCRNPDNWRWYQHQFADNGGVHRNCGILNKLAYLIQQTGSVSFNGITVTGIGTQGRQILYSATDSPDYDTTDDFHGYRDGLVTACARLYGAGSNACQQLDNAWNAVGLWAPEESESGWLGSRPGAYCWQGFDDQYWLYLFYPGSNGNIRWRWVDQVIDWWGSEQSVYTGGTYPNTDRPVTVAPWGDYLYVFYKMSATTDIKYFRMDRSESFTGPFAISTGIAHTDGAPAVVPGPTHLSVVFKRTGQQTLGHVWSTDGVNWATGPTPPADLTTNDGPYARWYGVEAPRDWVVFVRKTNCRLGYTWFDDGASGWGWAPAEIPQGAREFDALPPPNGGWAYGAPCSDEVPTGEYWYGDLVVTHKRNGSTPIYMQAYAVPRYQAARVWGPKVEQPWGTGSGPTVVRTLNTTGSAAHSLWLVHQWWQQGNEIRWTETRGGQ